MVATRLNSRKMSCILITGVTGFMYVEIFESDLTEHPVVAQF